ncbi:MAG: DUF554 domain-containing protein [Anaerovorax sp.]|nr:DUF554 domain-containing protein [Anaerovorax sp.]
MLQQLIGPIVNGIAIIICALLGRFVLKGLPKRFEDITNKALGLSVLYIGISGSLQNQRVMLLILSLVIGSAIGELIDIDKQMNRIGKWAELVMGFGEGNFSKGFVTASVIFCTGSMAVIGGMNSGLQGNHEMLFAKSILDGVFSIMFGSSLGIGVAFSAIPVFLYEGAIALCSGMVKDLMTPEIVTEMSAVGSLIIAAIGLNFILDKQQIKVANMIPAIFLPWLFIAIETALNL